MTRKPIRVYADTSVYGGVFDSAFAHYSTLFFEQVSAGFFELTTSGIVKDEIAYAPLAVQQFYKKMAQESVLAELVPPEALYLRERYIEARIVGSASRADALHVAIATVLRCSVLVSWNFKHIVHFQKIPLYNAVNVVNGYFNVAICSPAEVTMS